MHKKNYLIVVLLAFFLGLNTVFAVSSGVSDTTHYEETDRKTNYIKVELIDGNVILFEIDTSNSTLARKFKELIADAEFDGVSTHANVPGSLIVGSDFMDDSVSCSEKRFAIPKYGDLVALYDGDACYLSGFSINLLEQGSEELPVIGHVIAGEGVLHSSLARVQSIRFVEISNENEATAGGDADKQSGGTSDVAPESITHYCDDKELLKAFKFIGRILSVVKIIIPLVIIILGAIDFFRAVIASKDDEIKKSMKTVLFRVLAGVIIFFLPTIINLVFLLIDDWNHYRTDYSVCSTCITNPGKCAI